MVLKSLIVRLPEILRFIFLRISIVSGLLCLAGVIYFLLAPSHMAEILLSAQGLGNPLLTWNAAMAQVALTMALADSVVFDTWAKYRITTFDEEGSEGRVFSKHHLENLRNAQLYFDQVLAALEP